MRIDEIEYDDVTPEVDEYAGIDYRTRQRIEHFEGIGRPYLADAIRVSNGLQPKHPLPKRKSNNFDDIRVDNYTGVYDDLRFTSSPGCGIDKAMQCLKKIRINNDKFI